MVRVQRPFESLLRRRVELIHVPLALATHGETIGARHCGPDLCV